MDFQEKTTKINKIEKKNEVPGEILLGINNGGFVRLGLMEKRCQPTESSGEFHLIPEKSKSNERRFNGRVLEKKKRWEPERE